MPRSLKPTQKETRFLPVAWLTIAYRELAHPLRSSPIAEPSTLLLDDLPPSCASILSPFVGLTYFDLVYNISMPHRMVRLRSSP